MDRFVEFVEKVNERARKGEIKVENTSAYSIGSDHEKGITKKL